MKSDEELLSFLDLLDLDEEIIDLRIKCIIQKTSFSDQNLSNLLHLLQYKNLINTKEDCECENDQEFMIVTNLLANMTDKNVEFTAKIVYNILILNPTSIVYKAEHLFQQIIANMHIPHNVSTVGNSSETEYDKLNSTFLQLKICQSILNAVISCRQKLSLPFLESPLEYLVCTKHEPLNTFFLTSVIPQIFEGISGFHILDRIWNLIKQLQQSEVSLKVLCSLSNYYLPMPNESMYESEVISYSEFWEIIYYGLSSNSSKNRKFSMYLIKRAIDCLMPMNKDVYINFKCTFTWTYDKKEKIRSIWNDFFVLMESLEEKQSNIVLPSLILINTVKELGYSWLNCAFNMALTHDNNPVRFKCILHRLDYPIHNLDEAVTLLEAINDTNFFGEEYQQISFEKKMKISLENHDNVINILKTMPIIKWAPVPLFYITRILKDLNITVMDKNSKDDVPHILQNLLKLPCTNTVIRKAIYVNLSLFIKKCRLRWRDYINICACLPTDINLNIKETDNTHSGFIKSGLTVPEEEYKHLLDLANSYVNIDFALIYFSGSNQSELKEILIMKLNIIKNISERQYSKKSECISDAIFITEFYRRIQSSTLEKNYIDISYQLCNVILNYIKSLLSSDTHLGIEDLTLLFEGLNVMVPDCTNSNKEVLLQLLVSSLLVLKDVTVELNMRVISILTLSCVLKCPIIVNQNLPESEIVNTLINGLQFGKKENNESIGRLKNIFYEKSSEIFYLLIKNNNSLPVNSDILNFIDHITDSGGYGCLHWILQIVNKIIPYIVQASNNYISKFLSIAWREIEELKTNSQYSICIKEFVTILLHDDLLKNSMYNNMIVMYCSRIIEYGSVKSLPLYYLVNEMNSKNISDASHIIYIFSDILLYSVVPKKENRISEDVTEVLLRDTKYNICKTKDFHFISYIRYLSLDALSKISEPEILNTVADFIIKRVDEIFKNKQRYHGNSQVHRTVQAAIQNLLFMTLSSRLINIEKVGRWCMELLGKLPHQQFVRTCLEWYIALYIYIKNRDLNNDVLYQLQSKNVPITSQFLILYFVLIRKLKSNVCTIDEYQFVFDTYLSHTMGPTYSVRLYAQYLAHRINESGSKFDLTKYHFILEVIDKTLKSASAEKDKSYQKLLNDYFVHKFDIVEDLTPWHIYHYLQMSDNFNENIDFQFFDDRMNKIYKNIDDGGKDSFYEEWRSCRKNREYSYNFKTCDNVNNYTENKEVGTIQKKYVPWKSMSDVGICGTEEKGNKSDLIVVASLIDRLPNLGGMARTSEVFGVLTYVVDSLRYLQDKQFQGLSVSAERWINVEEVRPGKPLKDYLMMKKSEGYSIVAAEQTSSSTPLQTFKFPKKTLLLLGHEKEGVPCDFLPLMDACVEIPQQGVIRSLNVHVTAAIFVWEYARQIML